MVESEKLIEDELIAGAIDLHAHGYPEVTLKFRGRVTDHQWAETVQPDSGDDPATRLQALCPSNSATGKFCPDDGRGEIVSGRSKTE